MVHWCYRWNKIIVRITKKSLYQYHAKTPKKSNIKKIIKKIIEKRFIDKKK
jgi:hypothetical protein